MAFNELAHRMGHQGLKEAAEKGMRALVRLRNVSLQMKEQAGQTIQTLEVNAAAFAFGFSRGYFAEPGKDLSILGVPLDLASGVAGHALALFGGLGKYGEDFHNLSDGALASYSTTLGLKIGVEQRDKRPAALPQGATRGFDVGSLVDRVASAV